MSKITIVMYHYVRDLKHSRYSEIKGLDVALFQEQVHYLLKYYAVIRMEELIESVRSHRELPDNSLLLTFDDGYLDHFEFVFPILNKLNIQGSFFPSAKAILEHCVLDVNKIHFVLAAVFDKKEIISDIYLMLDRFRKKYHLESNGRYYRALAIPGKYDTAEVMFIKRILQRELPEKLRRIMVDFLFNKYVSEDETSFSKELYMNMNQLRLMKKKGMYIGSHGYNHYWLNTLSRRAQKKDIDLSLRFLKKIGCDIKDFVFCYPYGAYNKALLSLLKEYGCSLGLTTEVKIADLEKDEPLALGRLDTNDLPKHGTSKPNHWTQEVINNFKQIVT